MLDTRYSILDNGHRAVNQGVVGGSRVENRASSIWFVAVAVLVTASQVGTQELVPAAYTPAPYGVNLLSLATTYSSGDIAFAPSVPIEETTANIFASTLTYARTLKVAGRSATATVIAPYVIGDLEGIYIGEPASAERSGIGDVVFRGGINLYGGPAMSPKEFSTYRPRTLIGASLIVSVPTGQYDPAKLINIGTNRWSFKPEIGVVHVMGRWAIDAYVGAWFYTDNTDFFGGQTREQEPILSTQAHVRYLIKPGLWAAIDGNYWNGGQTTVGGVVNDDEQRNSRVGLTVSIKLSRSQSLRVAASRGAITRIGGDFASIGVSYGYSWLKKP